MKTNKRKKKDEDKNLIPSRTQIRIKNVMKTKVPKNTSPKKPVGKMKQNLSKTTTSKKASCESSKKYIT